MRIFDELLQEHRSAVDRFVKFKMPTLSDAEDILSEVYLVAYNGFGTLKSEERFKPWLLGIARNKINDYFRRQSKRKEVPLDAICSCAVAYSRLGRNEIYSVRDILGKLSDIDREVLYLFYWKELSQVRISELLEIPLGTVKSRLYNARQNFKALYLESYPSYRMQKGETKMKALPEIIPKYTIVASNDKLFGVKWEELMGWLIVPKLGEKLSWGLYEQPSGKRTEWTELEVVGKAEVHGIEGVEIKAIQHDAEDYYRTGSVDEMERRFIAQLTDTHCRYLAESHVENGIRKCYTFLDGDYFAQNWGFGEDNCGSETNMSPKGMITREGSVITACEPWPETLDVVGRYTVTIGGKAYDTVCIMDCECFNDAVATEQYVDKNGRTVLWRRFNRNDWAFSRYGKLWTEMYPDNERINVNGETYVHWYDCISDYIV